METTIYRASERGFANHGWLKANHTFSFANYYNPKKMGFGAMRVLNDDTVAPAMGFGKHPHDNMEIVTIPLSGALKHEDSEGNSAIIYHGDVQHMSAGTGIYHSEKNASHSEEVKLFQIWIFPKERNIAPVYHQKSFEKADRQNKFQVVVSPFPEDEAVYIHQDALFYLGDLDENKEISFKKKFQQNGIYLMVIEGEIEVLNQKLEWRDAIGIEEVNEINIVAKSPNTQLLLIEVPI
jgi:quercetin 2,3-dioxygenase